MKITFYLFNNDNTQHFEDLLDTEKQFSSLKFPEYSHIEHNAYYITREIPYWIKYLKIDSEQPSDETQKVSDYYGMVIFFRIKEKIIASCFGMGYNFLNHDKIISDFGRRVVINSIDEKHIKSVKTTDMGFNTRIKNVSRIQGGNIKRDFGLDDHDLIFHRIEGSPKKQTPFTGIISGDASLTASVDSDFSKLYSICTEIVAKYEQETDEELENIFNRLKPINKGELASQLDAEVIKLIREKYINQLYFHSINYDISDSYQYIYDSQKSDEFVELEELPLCTLLSFIDSKNISENDIFHIEVRGYKTGRHKPVIEVNIREFLIAEITLDNETYIHIGRKWYHPQKDFKDEIERKIKNLKSDTDKYQLPDCIKDETAKTSESEGDYNKRAGEETGFFLLDGKLINNIEVADLAEVNEELTNFYCVKKWSRSAKLSHLFSQGSVSALNLKYDQKYSDEVKRKLNLNKITENICFIYAIIGKPAEELPLFSKINLVFHTKTITDLGYDVKVCHIPYKTSD